MLVVKNLKKSYGKREIIKDVSFEVKKGQIFSILGPNGAGKTTCFYMIFGIVNPNSGKIFLNEHDITNVPIYMKSSLGIGYLPQESSIFQGLTTEENIIAVLENFVKNKDERMAKLNELINDFHLSHVRDSMSMSLSGGEKRRLEIARLLASDPDFILLDEPFAGVDPVSTKDIIDIIKSLAAKNIGIIITDHNVREIMQCTDEMCIIYEGKILVQGQKEEILANDMVKKIYLGSDFKY